MLGAAALAKGGRRAGGGGAGEAVGEAVAGDAGEAQAEPLAGDAGEAVVGVVGVVGESGVGTRGGGVAHRGRLLELDIDTASPAASLTARLAWSLRPLYCKLWRGGRRGVRWAREHARPTRPTGGRGRGPRGGRWRAALRGCGEMGKGVRVRVCVCERVRKGFCGPKQGMCVRKGTCSLSDTEGNAKVFAFVSMVLTREQTLWVSAHSSEVTLLFLSPSHSLVMPSVV